MFKSVAAWKKKRKEYLLKQLRIATPEALLKYMMYEPHEYGDILFLTGVGKSFVYAFSQNAGQWQHLFRTFCDVLSRIVQRTDLDCLESFGRALLSGIQPFVMERRCNKICFKDIDLT
ncbi:MAG: hypothetical protein ACLT0Y_04335 [Christensenellales bacterium]